MSLMLWNPKWETGIPLIDEQHRQLLGQFETLLMAIHENRAEQLVQGLLAFLPPYVETHFATEELHMEATGYPGFSEHKAFHDGYRIRVASLCEGFQKDQAILTEEAMDFLTDLLVDHIDTEDRRMARHLLRHGLREAGAGS